MYYAVILVKFCLIHELSSHNLSRATRRRPLVQIFSLPSRCKAEFFQIGSKNFIFVDDIKNLMQLTKVRTTNHPRSNKARI